jgi:NAD(P)-dependent dehydrogenase (short-subunit alcohol dehydrogenase family)
VAKGESLSPQSEDQLVIMTLENRVAIVTGAGRGIGQALALGFARAGASLVIIARNSSELAGVEREVLAMGGKVTSMALDLSQRDTPARIIERALADFGTIDILINNAAVGSSANPKPVVDFDDDFWGYTLTLNLTAPYLLSKAALPVMLAKKRGRILNISSLAGKIGLPHGAAYSASKHGLLGLTRSLAIEVVKEGITVNAICPGPVRSEASDKRIQFEATRTGLTAEELERRSTPIGRRLEPREIVPIALLLADDHAAAITGQAYNVDGGLAMF